MRFVLDGRNWRGGIGRFARETTPFLPSHDTLHSPLRPTHPLAPLELTVRLRSADAPFFSHGYLPPLRSRVPAIVTVHDLMYLPGHTAESRSRAAYMAAIRPMLRRCAAIVTMSNSARLDVSEWLEDHVRVVAVGGGVSPAFGPVVRPAESSRPIVLYVGSRAPNKNVRGVLRGFAQSRLASTLLVTGTAHQWNEDIRDANVDLSGRVTFLGSVPEASLPDVYRKATILLMPSIEEGYGLPALEAMATGLPVVYGTDRAMREVVADAGVSVNPYDDRAIGAAIDALISDPSRARTLAQIGLTRAAERTWSEVAGRIAGLIESVA